MIAECQSEYTLCKTAHTHLLRVGDLITSGHYAAADDVGIGIWRVTSGRSEEIGKGRVGELLLRQVVYNFTGHIEEVWRKLGCGEDGMRQLLEYTGSLKLTVQMPRLIYVVVLPTGGVNILSSNA